MIRHKTALISTIIAALAVIGAGAAYAAVTVPNSGGQLTGTVYVCVNSANESHQYVELGHPAAGNCAAGYLQYTANQPAPASSSSSAPEVNSESFTEGTKNCGNAALTTASVTDSFCVSLPAGSHLTAVTGVVDENSSVASPVTASVTSFDSVTGQVDVKFSVAPALTDQIQVTYDYSL